MKEVKLLLPKKHEDALNDLIDDFKISAFILESKSDTLLCLIWVTSEKVNALVSEAKKRGIGSAFGSIIINNVIIVESGEQTSDDLPSRLGVNVEEILGSLRGNATISPTYLLLTGLAAVLASLGLYYDSVVTIIASMIVAPLMGPIALTAAGLIYPEEGILKDGIIAEIAGLFLSVILGLVVGLMLPTRQEPTHEMLIRAVLSPDVFWFAVFSGAAAGVIISRGMDLSIVGVAIAASLAPPAVNMGLLLAQGHMDLAIKAGIIVLLNILAIDFSCGLMFALYGVTETAGVSQRQTSRAKRLNYLVLIIIGGLLTVIGVFIVLQGVS